MLRELRVSNLLLIEHAELRLSEGLNVITGETGAGKTVLAHALDLLLGGKPRAGIVRPGAKEAWVEGAFDVPDQIPPELAEVIEPDDEEVVLARRVSAEGRTRALVNGRTATVGDLRALAEHLLTFYGQHEHRRLTLAGAQMEILDEFCGEAHLARREAVAGDHAAVREAERELQRLRELAGARDRELDLLEFELAEIESASPDADEQEGLRTERERLRHTEALREAAALAAAAVDDDEAGAAQRLAGGGRGLESVAGVDPGLDALAERWAGVVLELQDVGAELRAYAEGLEGDAGPGRLEAVEERLGVLDRLERKHGGSLEAVLEYADRCRARREELVGAEVALADAQARLQEAQTRLLKGSAVLRKARAKAGPSLASAVRERLAELAMEGASFSIELTDREPGPTGSDAVEFLIAPNPGVPATPLRDTASGGEMSRVMLALMGAAAAGGHATLIFDEVDAGIGGQTARSVGEQLRALAEGRQVLCITHLPQVASLAQGHFSIAKDTSQTPARTTVQRLDDREVVGELVRMLGADDGDKAATKHARELLKAA